MIKIAAVALGIEWYEVVSAETVPIAVHFVASAAIGMVVTASDISVISGISFFQNFFNVKLSIAFHASSTKHIESSIEKLFQNYLTLKLDSKL